MTTLLKNLCLQWLKSSEERKGEEREEKGEREKEGEREEGDTSMN